MASTAIHIRPLQKWSREINDRDKNSECIREDLSDKNEFWTSIKSLSSRRAEIKKIVLEKTGRKMQERAVPLKEGLVVINEKTTMTMLQQLAKNIQQLLGVETVQICIHRDSGHWEDKVWIPNLHAHMVFDWYNHETGKSFRCSPLCFNQLQTITAETLGMERGKPGDNKHLSTLQYKYDKMQNKYDALKKEYEELLIAKEELVKELSQLKEQKV